VSGQSGFSHKPLCINRILKWVGGIAAGTLVVLIILLTILSKYPSVGARGADYLRTIIGDKAVAGMEMVIFEAQDIMQRWKFKLGIADPADDWAVLASPSRSPTVESRTKTPQVNNETGTPNRLRTVTPTPTATIPWQPIVITPMSKARGEGVWIPYLQDLKSQTVAYKTFLQPDLGRPYTIVTIIAMDLNKTSLHYVLGTEDPTIFGTPAHPGKVPDSELDILLAAFNGGFQARHGQFGAMSDGNPALPPRDGLGTLVIKANGDIRMGEWGTDIFMTPDIVSFRQNGPLVINHGDINLRIYNNSPQDWGYTVIDVSPTIRSGIGLSQDNKTLYYFCGPSLTMDALARSMQTTGAFHAIQLDINNYWVLFVKFSESRSKLVTEPLLPHLMVDGIDRYLYQSPRDFFYLTNMGIE
jgi:hypothetical protein